MSITDELRKAITTLQVKHANDNLYSTTYYPSPSRSEFTAIADRIDAEHEAQLNDAFETRNSDENQENDGWIRLPKDANGEYIHIGDELDGYGYPKGGAYCKAIVNEVTILAGPKDSSYRSWLMWDASEVRHHHEPTIEDVLREFGERYCDTVDGCAEESELFAEYAAKLQLRGDGE